MAQVDYDAENPFEESSTPKNPFESDDESSRRGSEAPPPVLPAKRAQNSVPQQRNDPELQARYEKLKAKEEEINRRETVLETRAELLEQREHSSVNPNPPNWPRCRPLIRHDISADMPTPEAVRFVRLAYGGWIAGSVMLGINAICLLAVLIEEGSGQAIGDFVLACVYFLILTIIWFLIYRILYKAAKKAKPALYIVYWVFYFFVMLTHIFVVVGFPGCGVGGLWYMFQQFSHQKMASGFMLLANSILWGCLSAYCIMIYIWSRVQYNQAGGIEMAKKNMKDGAIGIVKSNPDLAKKAMKAAAKEAANHPDIVIDAAKAARQ